MFASPDKNTRGVGRILMKPSTSSRVCITVSNSPNPSRVYVRLCKHGKRFLFALITRRPYCPGGPKKLCFTTLSLIPMVSIARLSGVKQSSFGLPGQYDRRVTRVNCLKITVQAATSGTVCRRYSRLKLMQPKLRSY